MNQRSQTVSGAAVQQNVVDQIDRVLRAESVNRSELSKRLGISKPATTTLLSPGGNLTIRSMTRVADALGYTVDVTLRKIAESADVVQHVDFAAYEFHGEAS